LGLLPRTGLLPKAIKAALSNTRRETRYETDGPCGIGGIPLRDISLIVDANIASRLQAGSVSWLPYADRLMEFATALLACCTSGTVLSTRLE
jgi:putative peptidoglycan lipid II flippase